MRYVALLRGVNVGGHRRVPRAEFQSVLEGLGFREVTIYLNSGNAVFTSDSTVDSHEVQTALEAYFGFAIPTLVISGDRIRAIAQAIPTDWTNDTPTPDKSGQKSDVIYLFDTVNKPTILEEVGYRPELETMRYLDGAIITMVLRRNQSRGSLQKLIGTKLYGQMTIRNITTAKKLAELVEQR